VEPPGSRAGVKIVKPLIEKNKQNLAHTRGGLLEMLSDAIERNLGGFLGRIAVGASANCGEADGPGAALLSQFQTLVIAACQLFWLALPAISIDRTDGVNHMLRRKRARRSYDGAPRWATSGGGADFIQLAHDRGPAGSMNGAIHAATAPQSGIRCIDDGVNTNFCDVANDQTEFFPVREINLHDRIVPRYSRSLNNRDAMVLFDIDGTLIRRAGPHHRQALVEAIRRTVSVETTTDGVPVAGMLDRDILATMMTRAGMKPGAIKKAMPAVIKLAQSIYVRSSPDLARKVCPGVRRVLRGLQKRGVVTGLVTGNLSRIGWRKMERAGLRPYFRFGAFAELAKDRAGLVRFAIRYARREGWISRKSRISLIGDHPNDVRAAKANGIRSIAVATGLTAWEELESHSPDIIVPDLRSLTLELLL
jgi:phosphoglycolate phosphatase